jgi:uncharacterized membrane protein YkoI
MKKTMILLGVAALGLLAGCTQNNTGNSEPAQNSSSSSAVASSSEPTSSQAVDTSSSSAAIANGGLPAVKVEEAIQIFQDKYPDAAITSIDLDTSFGKYFYQVEGVDDTNEYEMKIDAETKATSEERTEKLDADEQNGVKKQEDQLDLTNLRSLEEISNLAVKEAGGGQATDWDLDKEMNITYWEVKVENGSKKTDVKINAQTGEVLETEQDD